MAAEITEIIVCNTGTDTKYIYVLFEDMKPQDWAGEGKFFGEDAKPSPNHPQEILTFETVSVGIVFLRRSA
jgi:4-oxalocrotonate tautomerase